VLPPFLWCPSNLVVPRKFCFKHKIKTKIIPLKCISPLKPGYGPDGGAGGQFESSATTGSCTRREAPESCFLCQLRGEAASRKQQQQKESGQFQTKTTESSISTRKIEYASNESSSQRARGLGRGSKQWRIKVWCSDFLPRLKSSSRAFADDLLETAKAASV